LQEIAATIGVSHFRVWFDRDPAGAAGQAKAIALVNASGDLTATGFDWAVAFPSPARGRVPIPASVTDPGECSPEQLRFLRRKNQV
jgi:hypothetical protein